MRSRIPLLKKALPLKRMVLFGSYATGRHTVASDIDLLVVYAGDVQENAYALVRRTLGVLRLEPHVYSEGEYELVQETVNRMIQKGIEVDAP
ncbi:MAG: nucleotidyltransferase domain-containing protein [Candidatus Binatia bacterium]